jgi:GNAT superfamily N-acetyltransferase
MPLPEIIDEISTSTCDNYQMAVQINHRSLNDQEIELLEMEMKSFPDIGFLGARMWKKFGKCYVVTVDDTFAGVCAAIPLHSWVKMGPLIVLRKFQGKGLGKQLVQAVVLKHKGKKLYIGSSNPHVVRIVAKLNFKKESNFFKLPYELQLYQLKYLIERLSLKFLIDAIQKRVKYSREQYCYFLLSDTYFAPI